MRSSRWPLRLALLAVALLVAAAPAAAVKRRAFVTSVSGSGNLSSWPDAGGQTGLAAGDQICRARAAAAGLPNANAYRAWLSTAATDAYCHVQGLTGSRPGCGGGSGDAAGPWYLSNGITNFTGDLDELTSADVIYRPVMWDELMDEVGQADGEAWTGTWSNGVSAVGTCADWTSASNSQFGTYGHALATSESWSEHDQSGCAAAKRLLCFEPGASEPLTGFWSPSALVFVTSEFGNGDLGGWPEAGSATGLAAGDAICQNLAAAAHLPAPGSFVAWLSTGAVDAVDRLTTNGPFARIDGFRVANSKPDLVDGASSNSLHMDESGEYLDSGWSVHTGTLPSGLSSGFDCGGWTESTSGFSGTWGYSHFARTGLWTDFDDGLCNLVSKLYCVSNRITLFWDGFELTGDTGRWSSTAN